MGMNSHYHSMRPLRRRYGCGSNLFLDCLCAKALLSAAGLPTAESQASKNFKMSFLTVQIQDFLVHMYPSNNYLQTPCQSLWAAHRKALMVPWSGFVIRLNSKTVVHTKTNIVPFFIVTIDQLDSETAQFWGAMITQNKRNPWQPDVKQSNEHWASQFILSLQHCCSVQFNSFLRWMYTLYSLGTPPYQRYFSKCNFREPTVITYQCYNALHLGFV